MHFCTPRRRSPSQAHPASLTSADRSPRSDDRETLGAQSAAEELSSWLSPLRLRRLYKHRAVRPGPVSNPFEEARRRQATTMLRVGLHSSLLLSTETAATAFVEAIRTPHAHGAIEVLPVFGWAPEWLPRSHRYRILQRPGGGPEAFRRYRTRDGGRQSEFIAMRFGDAWEWEAVQLGFDERVFDELDVLANAGSDLIVTVDDRLLTARDHFHLPELNLMTPAEALVVIGTWCRWIHQPFIRSAGVTSGLWYWAAARAVTPSGWPAHCAFVYGQYDLPDGGELVDLAGSILDHLKTLFRNLDDLLATWHCKATNDTNDEMIQAFTSIVGTAWSLHHNLARLSGRYLGLDLGSPTGWDFGPSSLWTTELGVHGDPRAGAMLALAREYGDELEAMRAFRNYLAHRERPRMRRMRMGRGPDELRLAVHGDLIRDVRDRLALRKDRAAAWGFGPVTNMGAIPTTDVSTGETHDVYVGREALLDVVAFGARSVALAAVLADSTFGILAPARDLRVRRRSECDIPQTGLWQSVEGATSVILQSGVAGLL